MIFNFDLTNWGSGKRTRPKVTSTLSLVTQTHAWWNWGKDSLTLTNPLPRTKWGKTLISATLRHTQTGSLALPPHVGLRKDHWKWTSESHEHSSLAGLTRPTEWTPYLWPGAPAVFHARAGRNTCKHTEAVATEPRAGPGRGPRARAHSQNSSKYQTFQLPDHKN